MRRLGQIRPAQTAPIHARAGSTSTLKVKALPRLLALKFSSQRDHRLEHATSHLFPDPRAHGLSRRYEILIFRPSLDHGFDLGLQPPAVDAVQRKRFDPGHQAFQLGDVAQSELLCWFSRTNFAAATSNDLPGRTALRLSSKTQWPHPRFNGALR